MPDSILLMVVAVIALGIAAAAVKQVQGKRKPDESALPYERIPHLFTAAERSFLGVLEQAVGERLRVMGKIRLADVVKVKSGLSGGARQTAINRIQSKHVDFVVCDRATLSVAFVVELDDQSHNRPARRDRDQTVDSILRAAGVPVLHVKAQPSYTLQEVRSAVASLQPRDHEPLPR